MHSLSRKLSLSLAASLALFFLMLVMFSGLEIQSQSEKTVLARMQHDMESLLAASQIEGDLIHLDQNKIDAIYKRPFSGHYFQLQLMKPQVSQPIIRSRSLWDVSLDLGGAGIRRNIRGPEGQHLLVYGREFSLFGEPVILTLAEDTSLLKHESERFQQHLLLLFVVAMIVLLGLQIWIIRRSLKPLRRVDAALRRLEQGETTQLELNLPGEIMPLVSEVNRLLLLMHERMVRSRTATGNLAHALKTPLAVIRRNVESGAGDERLQQISEQSEKIETLIERELSRARLAGGGAGAGGYWPEPESDLREIVRILGQVHDQKVTIELDVVADFHPPLDREDMLELAGNLLDNACKWAEKRVHCTLSIQNGALLLSVEDDGPGMSEADWRALVGRGMRSDESRPGHGLGLSIVADIVASYQGELKAQTSETLGGLAVGVILPLRG